MRTDTPSRPTGPRSRRTRPARRRAAVALAALGAVAGFLGACGDDADGPVAGGDAASPGDSTPAPGTESAEVALQESATVIDVRTPQEYAEGHIEGAESIDVQGTDFDDRVAALDPDLTYVVYCRTGNRSAQAAGRMAAAGLTVLDGGGMDDMLAAGWPEAT